jgi:multiple sugar transport system ATP-binding protein
LRPLGSGLAFAGAGLNLPVVSGGRAGELITLGVRPEDVTLGDGPFSGTVRVVEPTGHETIVMIGSGAATLVCRARPDEPLVVGASVPFALRTSRLHAFDAPTGRRLPLSFVP